MAAACPKNGSSPTRAGFQRLGRSIPTVFGAFGIVGLTATAALAQGSAPAGVTGVPGLDALLPPGNGAASGRIIQLVALLTVLSLAPGLLVMVTSFTRFAVAFSFLRSGLGLQSTPANLFLVSLALFMTFYVMAPTFDRAWNEGVKPLQENRIGEEEALAKIVEPFREFMTQHVRPKDLKTFTDLASRNFPKAEAGDKIDLRILIPAFMISELRRGFEIGFLIVLPFLVIDIIVSTIVMSMGMMMLPPTVISLPFKVLFFILIDGWNLLVSGLVRSFF
ncbi:Flagellar biosynthetic protein FliP [Methylorubrum suomiense]|uniref:Flagellar biosynthetic protein FliP n=1 Tax=Methylorubrum suomiense TaxID=144191 RepID=A0ABQ4UY94_9HYPH|nr:flagellar type III secretion system pore protein FliP [Methylobacterium sp. L1A1]GJE76329.1 Flagellar biosynthetic protein FliP [Methylorubrum suomiense]